jgi:hypothetical protein
VSLGSASVIFGRGLRAMQRDHAAEYRRRLEINPDHNRDRYRRALELNPLHNQERYARWGWIHELGRVRFDRI